MKECSNKKGVEYWWEKNGIGGQCLVLIVGQRKSWLVGGVVRSTSDFGM